ncbi:phytanoyl-CoA dioxygenase family protein [Dactylosporangium sp. NPDC050688]|uniref:phytanoyl-CoA dioxygenase family protein n=1 Tax=Dactylosporangium sp. NPDC050688 TaxID=3157217 RepID=UPI0033C6A49A
MQPTVIDAPLTAEKVDAFWEDGYLLVPGVLSREEAAHYGGLILDLMPRDLHVPDHWEANDGRFKPFYTRGNDRFDGPEFIPLFQHERLYRVMAQLLRSPRLFVRDGSVAITMRTDTPHDSELSQPLHLDPATPGNRDEFLFTLPEVEIGGCYYFTDVEVGGGGIHVVPGGHRAVEREARAVPRGRQRFNRWREFAHLFPETVEVPGNAGDFVLMHHLMPHAASYNRRSRTRLAQFFRYCRDDQPYVIGERPGDQAANRVYGDLQLAAMTPLGRKLLGVDPW